MIDLATAIEIAQVIRVPIEQAFLQQIGRQAAEALPQGLSRLKALVTGVISSTQPQGTTASSVLELESMDQEELAAQILIAAKKDPEAFHDILTQYRVVRGALNPERSTGDISAMASEGAVLTQTVVQGDYFHVVGPADGSIPIASPPQKLTCSESARKLLSAAASDQGKAAVGIDYETILKAGELHIAPDADPREVAMWNAALEELVSLALLAPLPGSQRKVFQVTHRGYMFLEEAASMCDSED